MLVLTRKSGESVVIGDAIRISIERIRGGRVRLGVHAPRDVPVVRTRPAASTDPLPISASATAGTDE